METPQNFTLHSYKLWNLYSTTLFFTPKNCGNSTELHSSLLQTVESIKTVESLLFTPTNCGIYTTQLCSSLLQTLESPQNSTFHFYKRWNLYSTTLPFTPINFGIYTAQLISLLQNVYCKTSLFTYEGTSSCEM